MSCYIVKYGTEISHCPSPCSWWCHLKILPEGFRRTSCLKFTEGCCGLKLKEVKDIFCGTQAIENTNSCDEKCCPLFTFDLARRQQCKTTWFVSPSINNNPRFNATCIFELELARTQHLSLKKLWRQWQNEKIKTHQKPDAMGSCLQSILGDGDPTQNLLPMQANQHTKHDFAIEVVWD